MEMRYPLLFFIILIATIIYYFKIHGKKKKFYEGSKIANTDLLNENDYFQKKVKFYKKITLFLKACVFVEIICSALLISRLAKVQVSDIKKYNRDIMICMDVSRSVDDLNESLADTMKKTISSLNGERIGITIFNTSAVTLVPLTDDYEYLNDTLDKIKESISLRGSFSFNNDKNYLKNYIVSGTTEGNDIKGSSLIGDGLTSCIFNFTNLEEDKDRSRIIILSTDNNLAGTPKFSLKEAANIGANKNIMIFGIAPKNTYYINDFREAIESTGGQFYNYSDSTTGNIVNSINLTTKSKINSVETKVYDIPELPFIFLFISLSAIIIIDKKVIK